jgi:hypothetical protein
MQMFLCNPAFENLIVKKNQILAISSNFVKFGIIHSNFDWRRFYIVKNRKHKNLPNLPINQTELVEIQSNSSKIRWNSRGY